MSRKQILVIGRQPLILQTVVRLINGNEEWEATGTDDDEKAIELYHQQHFDLVLLGAGIDNLLEQKLIRIFTMQQPHIKIIQHFGGGSGLLFNEITAALEDNQEGNYNIIENPFSN